MTGIKQSIGTLLAVATLVIGLYAVWSYRAMAQRVVGLEATAEKYSALQAAVTALQQEATRRAAVDKSIRDTREAVNHSVEKAVNEDQQLADYLYQRIPDGLRRAYSTNRDVPAAESD